MQKMHIPNSSKRPGRHPAVVKNATARTYFVYILECADGSLYTGITTDIERRLREHNQSKLGAKYTRSRRPVKVVYTTTCRNRSSASRLESFVKGLSRQEKLALLRG